MRLPLKAAFAGFVLLLCLNLSAPAADFSIFFEAAPRYCLLRDINRGTNGYLDFWAGLSELSGGIVTEDKNPMHFVMSYFGNLIVALDSEHSLALGAGNFRFQSASEVLIRYTDGQPEATALVETRIDAVPIKLSAIRSYPLSRSLNAFIEGGFTAYIARYRSSFWPAGPGDSHVQDAHALGIGLLCGAGFELKASRHLALILKAAGEYAKIGGFKGTRNSGGSTIPHEVKGSLYFENGTYIPPHEERTFPFLFIEDHEPQSDGVRPARIDLSGVSLSAGLKVTF